jgi:hypothetical protein
MSVLLKAATLRPPLIQVKRDKWADFPRFSKWFGLDFVPAPVHSFAP